MWNLSTVKYFYKGLLWQLPIYNILNNVEASKSKCKKNTPHLAAENKSIYYLLVSEGQWGLSEFHWDRVFTGLKSMELASVLFKAYSGGHNQTSQVLAGFWSEVSVPCQHWLLHWAAHKRASGFSQSEQESA